MRLIKLALISFVMLFLVVTALSSLLPSEVRISRAINLPPDGDTVLNLVAERERWKEWHPAFINRDPDSIPAFDLSEK